MRSFFLSLWGHCTVIYFYTGKKKRVFIVKASWMLPYLIFNQSISESLASSFQPALKHFYWL